MFTPQTKTKSKTTKTNFGMSKSDTATAKYPFQACKLYDSGGDVNKQWVVEYYVYNRDQDKLVRRRVSGFNRVKTARARKAAARELMQQIDELLRQGYTEGGLEALSDSLAFLQESEADFNLSTFTLRQAVVYFINYKNAATLKNKADRLEENYREGLARIKKNTFDAYRTFLKVLSAWLDEHKLNKLLLAQCNVKVVHQFFTHLKEEKGLGNKTFNNYRSYFSAVFNYYIEQQELLIKNPISRVLEVDDSELHLPATYPQVARFCTVTPGSASRQTH